MNNIIFFFFCYFDGDKLSGIELYEGIDLNNITDEAPCSDKSSCVKLSESTKEELTCE